MFSKFDDVFHHHSDLVQARFVFQTEAREAMVGTDV
jgi:hypothetical protein